MEPLKPQQKRIYEFGPFCIDAAERVLLREGKPLDLPPKLFDTLLALVEQSGHIVEKKDLMEQVWPDAFVEESNLVSNVSLLRKELGDGADGQPYIQTIPRRGYRFVAEVNERLGDDVDLILRRRTRARFVTYEKDETRALPEFSGALKSLAILPFMTIGLPAEEEYLGLGFTDALITQLGNTKQMAVRPTSAIRPFISTSQDSVTIGRALRVSAVLEGSVQRSASQIRVTVRLVNVADEVTLWAEKFDALFTDIFQVQDAIADQVARSLMLKLSGQERALLMKRYTENVEAYKLYLMGRYEWSNFTDAGILKSIDFYNRAISIDPDYALAYVGLAYSHLQKAHAGLVTSIAGCQLAIQSAEKAVSLDDTLAEAYCARALLAYFFEWDWGKAEAELQRAITLNPNLPDCYLLASNLAVTRKDTGSALAQIAVALELDPLTSLHLHTKAQVLCFAHRFRESIEVARRGLETSPHFLLWHSMLGMNYAGLEMFAEAIAEFESAVHRFGPHPTLLPGVAYAQGLAGNREIALKMIDELKRGSVPAYWLAVACAGLRDKEETLAWLERAYEERFFYLVWLNIAPPFEFLHSSPEFIDLLGRIGLA